jgi:hypothetical protein
MEHTGGTEREQFTKQGMGSQETFSKVIAPSESKMKIGKRGRDSSPSYRGYTVHRQSRVGRWGP